MRIALEIEHGVDHVFQHARPGQRALLGHVPDQDHRRAALLRQPGEPRRAFAHLRHRPRRRSERVRPQSLDRVDHRDLRRLRLQHGEYLFQPDFREQLELPGIQGQAPRAQGDLLAGFLAAHVEHLRRAGEHRQRLQEQGTLADARITADQHHAAGDQTAAERAVELADAGRQPVRFARFDFGEHPHPGGAGQGVEAPRRRRFGLGDGFDQRVPRATLRALSLPFRRDGAAFGTGMNRFRLGHRGPSPKKPSTPASFAARRKSLSKAARGAFSRFARSRYSVS